MEQLSGALASFPELHFLAQSLGGDPNDDERSLLWLLDRLNAGTLVHLHLLETPVLNVASASTEQRRFIRHLSPYLEDGRLHINFLSNTDATDLLGLPRVFVSLDNGTPVWFSVMPEASLLQDLLPHPVYRGHLKDATAEDLRRRLESANQVSPDAFLPVLPVQRWELSSGDPRPLQDWFAPVIGQQVARIDIKDPYCGAGAGQTMALVKLVHFFSESAAGIDQLFVFGKELSFRDPKYQPRHIVRNQVTEALRKVYSGQPIVLIQEFQKSRNFHDRTIDISMIDEDGSHRRPDSALE